MSLIKFLVDLATDEELRNRFEQDPRGVVTDYPVVGVDLSILEDGDRDRIRWHAVNRLVQNLKDLERHFPRPGPSPYGWEPPTPWLEAFDPDIAFAPGRAVDVEVKGAFFPPTEQAIFEFRTDKASAPAEILALEGADAPVSVATVRVTFSESGNYTAILSHRRTQYRARRGGVRVE